MKLKRVNWILSIATIFGMTTALLMSCKDDEPVELALVSLTADGIDLNAATSPTNVPPGATITAEFNTSINESTLAVILTRDYDNTTMNLNVSVVGSTVTIDPVDEFGTGTLFVLAIAPGLTSAEGKVLTQGIERNFTTDGAFAPAGAVAHWTFEDNANDVIGAFDPTTSQVVDITYVASRNTTAGKAASFNGSTSIIEISNGDDLMNDGSWTLSFWVKPSSANGKTSGHFVLGLGAFYGFQFEIAGDYSNCKLAARYGYNHPTNGAGTASEDLWVDATGNLGWQGWTFSKDLSGSGGLEAVIKDQWTHVALVYNAVEKTGTAYINGEKMKEQDFDLWPEGDNKTYVSGLEYDGVAPEVVNELAFGFIQSRAGTLWDNETWGGYDFASANHFQGELDDIRIYFKTLTLTEIDLMYNSEK